MAKQRKPNIAVRRTINEINDLEGKTTQQVVSSINRLRQNIILMLVETSEIDIYNRDIILSRLNTILADYGERIKVEISENQHRLFVRGIQVIDRSLTFAGLIPAVPYLDETLLEQIKMFTADLITGISDDIRHRIRQQVDLAVLGQKPIGDVIAEVGRNIKDPSIFGTVAKRAQVITETESRRIQRMASTERAKQLSDRFPNMKKQWNHAYQGTPRPGHFALDGVVIPVNEKFRLVGEDGTKYYVDAPYDPILPAGEVVNCRCFITMDVDEELKARA